MGKSRAPEAVIDLVNSYARLDGADVEMVLRDPRVDVTDESIVVLRRAQRRVKAPVRRLSDEHGTRLLVRAPRASLGDGSWTLRLQSGDENVPLEVRLLVQGDRPLALLWGARRPQSTLPRPHERRRGAAQPRTRSLPRRAAAKGVTMLPQHWEQAVRRQLRRG